MQAAVAGLHVLRSHCRLRGGCGWQLVLRCEMASGRSGLRMPAVLGGRLWGGRLPAEHKVAWSSHLMGCTPSHFLCWRSNSAAFLSGLCRTRVVCVRRWGLAGILRGGWAGPVGEWHRMWLLERVLQKWPRPAGLGMQQYSICPVRIWQHLHVHQLFSSLESTMVMTQT